jgi:hypothetical protein
MSDLMKESGAGSEVAGRPQESLAAEGTGWFVQDSDAAEIEAWIAFKRGEEPSSRQSDPQAAKRPRALIGLRKRGRH